MSMITAFQGPFLPSSMRLPTVYSLARSLALFPPYFPVSCFYCISIPHTSLLSHFVFICDVFIAPAMTILL